MRILGLDMGSKTIGVALSDPLGWTAQGITTIRRTKKEQDLGEVHKICNEYGVETIVVGLPKNMNGTIGESGEKALEFAELLKEKTGLPIEMWDENGKKTYSYNYLANGDYKKYHSDANFLGSFMADGSKRRIYTVDEAAAVTGGKNTFSIKYR